MRTRGKAESEHQGIQLMGAGTSTTHSGNARHPAIHQPQGLRRWKDQGSVAARIPRRAPLEVGEHVPPRRGRRFPAATEELFCPNPLNAGRSIADRWRSAFQPAR